MNKETEIDVGEDTLPSVRTGGFKRMIFRVLALFVIAPLLLLLTEFGFRLLTPFPATTLLTYTQNKDYMYFHMPNSMGWEVSPFDEFPARKLVYNSHGFRGDEITVAKPQGTKRIVLLGDSFVEARQVSESESVVKRVEELLEEVSEEKVQVINAGCSAYTTTTAYLLLKHHLLSFQPDAVVFVFSPNDYCDNYWYGNYSSVDDVFTNGLPEKMMPGAYAKKSQEHVTSWDKLENYCAIAAYFDYLKKKIVQQKSRLTVWKEVVEATEFHKSPLLVNKVQLNKEEQHVRDFTHEGLLQMRRLCKENGVEFKMVILPFPSQINVDEWKVGKICYGHNPDEMMEGDLYQRRLLAFANEKQIETIDVLPVFKQASGSSRLFLDYDGHMTPYGHDVLAREIVSLLTHSTQK